MISKEGWCQKEGGAIKTVKMRWFVLRGNTLHYYTKENGKEKGVIELNDETIVESDSKYKIQPCFTVQPKNNARLYRIFPKDNYERDDWVAVIKKAAANAARDDMITDPNTSRSAQRKARQFSHTV